jgi:hypothetical protein
VNPTNKGSNMPSLARYFRDRRIAINVAGIALAPLVAGRRARLPRLPGCAIAKPVRTVQHFFEYTQIPTQRGDASKRTSGRPQSREFGRVPRRQQTRIDFAVRKNELQFNAFF